MNPKTLLTNIKQNRNIFDIVQKEPGQNLPHCLSFDDKENKNTRKLNLIVHEQLQII